jgi:hypothetical protein
MQARLKWKAVRFSYEFPFGLFGVIIVSALDANARSYSHHALECPSKVALIGETNLNCDR